MSISIDGAIRTKLVKSPLLCPVFFYGRCGSTWLVKLLNSSRQVVAMGELFHPAAPALHLTGRDYHEVATLVLSQPELLRERLKRPAAFYNYLRNVVAIKWPDAEIFAFKISTTQEREVRTGLMHCSTYKPLLLNRRNVLAMYASFEIAKQSGIWHLTSEQNEATDDGIQYLGDKRNAGTAKVTFDEARFRSFVARVEADYRCARETMHAAGANFLEIWYEDLVSGQALPQIEDHLGIQWDMPRGRSGLVKLGSAQPLDHFQNPDDVRAYLQRIGKNAWADG